MADREQIEEMEHNLSLVMDYNEYLEDCGCGDQTYIEFEYNKMAKELINMGWTKPVWHKVADGDLPENLQEIRWVDSTGECYNGTYYGDGDGGKFSSDLGCDFFKDEVIAWMALPAYKE